MLRNLKVHCCIHHSTPFAPILSQVSSVSVLPVSFYKNHFNIFLPFVPRFSKMSLFLLFSPIYAMCPTFLILFDFVAIVPKQVEGKVVKRIVIFSGTPQSNMSYNVFLIASIQSGRLCHMYNLTYFQ
jgi:hypothetical protein